MGLRTILHCLLLALLAGLWPRPALADNWTLRIASWNIQDFNNSKAGLPPGPTRPVLLDFIAGKIAVYDIVFIQEIEGGGASLTQALAQRPALANYNCQTLSQPSGRGGPEQYGICYAPGPAGGGHLALVGTSDPMVPPPATYSALDGTQQSAQNVWMRPPFRATFTYTPPPQQGAPYTFAITQAHLKPAYKRGSRPLGTPAGTPINQSVANELTSTEAHLVQPPLWGLMGDLNADCRYYSASRDVTSGSATATNFIGPGWHWYIRRGQKTNVNPRTSCAYDRIIFNAGLDQDKLAHGIDSLGINATLNNKTVSDHFLIWVEIGKRDQQPQPQPPTLKRGLFAATASPVPAKRQRLFTAAPNAPPAAILINGVGMAAPAVGTTASLYVIPYDKALYRSGHAPMPLRDVRGSPTPVRVTAGGSFAADAVWATPAPGNYTLVLDADNDGNFDKFGGDFTNSDNEIDFIVERGAAHSALTPLDDNGLQREVFNANGAINVYGLARGLTAGTGVRFYVVADKLLPASFNDWTTLRRQGTLGLDAVSVPVNLMEGPIGPAPVPASARFRSETVAPDGAVLTSAWPGPFRLFNMAVLDSPPPVPSGDPGELPDDDDVDACAGAEKSSNADLRAACNVWPIFSDRYGTRFNLVVDSNSNGILDGPDLVDVHEIGDMQAFFAGPSNRVLDSSADGNPAVGEYKEYLSAKLSLNPPLTADNRFDARTVAASLVYLCHGSLARRDFDSIVKPGAQHGFQVLDQQSYERGREYTTGRYAYVDAEIDSARVPAGASVCIIGEDLDIEDANVDEDATLDIRGDNITLRGEAEIAPNAVACMTATASFGMTGGSGLALATLADPEPVTKALLTIALIVSSAIALESAAQC